MKTVDWRKLTFVSLWLVCIASLSLVVFLITRHWLGEQQTIREAKSAAGLEANRAAKEIDKEIGAIVPLVQSLAHDLGSGRLSKADLRNRLKTTLDMNPHIFEVGVAYAPFALSPRIRLNAPHYGLKDGVLTFFQAEHSYDYTEFDWYNNAVQKGANWGDPYFDRATQTAVVGFCVAFYFTDPSGSGRRLGGVARVNVSLKWMSKLLHDLKLGRTGYGFILSKRGTFIAHPTDEFVKSDKSIFDLAGVKSRDNERLRKMAEDAIRGKLGVIDYLDKETGESQWIFFEPVATTGWSLGAVFFLDEIVRDKDIFRQHVLWITIGVMLFLFSSSLLIFRTHKGTIPGLWAGACSGSAVLALGIIVTCYVALTLPPGQDDIDQDAITDKAALDEFLDDNAYAAPNQEKPPIYIPTGVFVQSVEFASAYNLIMSGYVWQKYANQIPANIARGFIMPEALIEGDTDITEVYRLKTSDGEVIGWRYRVTLRQGFDYSKYPFDPETIWIRLWHKDFYKNVILKPDFDAYDWTTPRLKPGLQQEDFVLPGWTVKQVFFSYRLSRYNTNFGIEEFVGKTNFPELTYNLSLQRHFVKPLVSELIPLTVVAFLLFCVLMTTSKQQETIGFLGFSTSAVLGYCAALIFVVIVSHISLRGELPVSGIIYIEYFYIVIYFALLAVSVNAILFANSPKIRLIQYEDNLIVKLLFWPVILGACFVITVAVFY